MAIKHISSTQIGPSEYARINIRFTIDDIEYQAFNVTPRDYHIYLKQVQFGDGYRSLHYLKSKGYDIEKSSLDAGAADELSKNIQQFLLDLDNKPL